jgi:MoCo/4Fe-4S cofactor protein with predicted Tat translocation signal
MSEERPADPIIPLQDVRRRAGANARQRFWRSLDELAETPGFLEFLHREFPEQASVFEDPRGRREFLTLMGASLALAGLTACTKQPTEHILPYVRQPEGLTLGRPLFFATASAHDGYARGILVESHEGRPTKVEGNPDHPTSHGATDVFMQAHVLGLYDPDRSRSVRYVGEERTFDDFRTGIAEALAVQRSKRGAGLRFLTGRTTSPTFIAQMQALLADLPEARWASWEPASRDNTRKGALLAFGQPLEARYLLDRADVILSLESDFITADPAGLRLQRELASRRKPEGGPGGGGSAMNRLYVVEGSPSLTGGSADHRLSLRSSEIGGFARAVAAGLGLAVQGGVAHPWVAPLVADLKRAGARAVVLVGETQPPEVHAIGHAMNEALGAAGSTVVYAPAAEASPGDETAALASLVKEMRDGRVDLLVMIGVNPIYAAPADLAFTEALDKVPLRIHHGLHVDETAERCHWHLPASHPLESWADARAVDGTVSLVQPLIAPLYETASDLEVLAAFTSGPERRAYDILRAYWQAQPGEGDFERRWNRALNDGVVAGTAFAPVAAKAAPGGPWAQAPQPPAPGGLEIAFRMDPCVFDGRFANLGWLQELPRPFSKIAWDNVAFVSPKTAESLGGIRTEEHGRGHTTDVVELRLGGRSVKAPAWVVPGRTRAGRVGTGVGFDAYPLRTSDAPWTGAGLEVRKTGETALVACTQDHWTIAQPEAAAAEERHVVRSVSLADLASDPDAVRKLSEDPPRELSLYEDWKYDGHAWGMSIDMSACTGCNACVVACQSENNIPVVGKEQVGRGREMHWIRVDRYFEGPVEDPHVVHQPVPCMHCENAPCELVCPVGATVHDQDGLNVMVYNRCVGTRYCSNNCPYKVRRFNFLLYQDWTTPTYELMRNPEVSVRSRGVMEKCTYCLQRIVRARVDAKNQGRPIKDGEIATACEAACPSRAIVFGDLNDKGSRVAKLRTSNRSYGMLTELQTRPRTTYLAHVRNPNPEIPEARRG